MHSLSKSIFLKYANYSSLFFVAIILLDGVEIISIFWSKVQKRNINMNVNKSRFPNLDCFLQKWSNVNFFVYLSYFILVISHRAFLLRYSAKELTRKTYCQESEFIFEVSYVHLKISSTPSYFFINELITK